jgi:hypothetical protein
MLIEAAALFLVVRPGEESQLCGDFWVPAPVAHMLPHFALRTTLNVTIASEHTVHSIAALCNCGLFTQQPKM